MAVFHFAFLIILATAIAGSATLFLSFILNLKEKNIFLGRYQLRMLFYTVFVILIEVSFYLYHFNILRNILPYLSLADNLIGSYMIAFAIWTEYPAVKKLRYRIPDRIFKITGLFHAAGILFTFFTDIHLFFIVRNIGSAVMMAAFITNFVLVITEREEKKLPGPIRWGIFVKIIVSANILFYPPTVLSLLFHSPNTFIAVGLTSGFITFPLFYILLQLAGLIFLTLSVLKPHYRIQAVSIHPDEAKKFGLSAREIEIGNELMAGLSYDDIGKKLFIGAETVKTHAANIYRKTGVKKKQDIIHLFGK